MSGNHGGARSGSGRKPKGPFLHGSVDGPQILSTLTVLSTSIASDRITSFFGAAGRVSADNTQSGSLDLSRSAVSGIVPFGSTSGSGQSTAIEPNVDVDMSDSMSVLTGPLNQDQSFQQLVSASGPSELTPQDQDSRIGISRQVIITDHVPKQMKGHNTHPTVPSKVSKNAEVFGSFHTQDEALSQAPTHPPFRW